MDEHDEAEVFESVWRKSEPIAKKLLHDTVGLVTEQVTGQESENSVLNDIRAIYLSLLQVYAKVLDIEANALELQSTLEDFKDTLE